LTEAGRTGRRGWCWVALVLSVDEIFPEGMAQGAFIEENEWFGVIFVTERLQPLAKALRLGDWGFTLRGSMPAFRKMAAEASNQRFNRSGRRRRRKILALRPNPRNVRLLLDHQFVTDPALQVTRMRDEAIAVNGERLV